MSTTTTPAPAIVSARGVRVLRFAVIAAAAWLIPIAASAQQLATVIAAPPRLDLTGISVALIGGVFTVLGIAIPLWVRDHLNDKAAAATLALAVKNSLGAIQQAATSGVMAIKPSVTLPSSIPPSLAVGVQYVLDHAGDEAARLGVTPQSVASKINAQIGLTAIAANVAANAPVTAAVAAPQPLHPVIEPVAGVGVAGLPA